MLPAPAPYPDDYRIGQAASARIRLGTSRRDMAAHALLAFGANPAAHGALVFGRVSVMGKVRAMHRRLYRCAQAENGRAHAILRRTAC